MSLLSQFFPSGSGASTSKITTNMLLVGGGGGGLPGSSGPPPACFPSCFSSPYYCSYRSGAGGGGGGAGEVFLFKNYSVTSGKQLTITVGSGGGDSSNGGTSIICVVDESNFIASGGKGTTTQCTTICEQYYSAVTSNNYGGGNGGTGCTFYCCPLGSFTAPLVCASSTANFCGQGSRSSLPSSCPSFCISNPYQSICLYDYSDAGIVIKGNSSKGGISPYLPAVLISNPSPYTFTRKSGQGGGGGGGSTGVGGAGCCGCPMSPCVAPGCSVKGGDGGVGGNGFTTDILGTSTCFALGGGGGGGSFTGTVGPSPYIPANCLYGRGGPSVNGGCGGRGSYSNPCCALCTCGLGCPGCAATANTGGGGGGGGFGYCTAGTGGSGGSGVVIIQYPTVYPAAPAPARPGSTDCSPSTPGCYTYKFNGPGSITLP